MITYIRIQSRLQLLQLCQAVEDDQVWSKMEHVRLSFQKRT